MARAVGIDLGTTNSVVAVLVGGQPTVIKVDGEKTLPSVVDFGETQVLVGKHAKAQTAIEPERVARSIKPRYMGRDYADLDPADKDRVQGGPPAVAGKNGKAALEIDGKQLLPQEISARVLQKLVSAASEYLGEPVTDVVITVPAYFNNAQRQATQEAGEIAGLNVLRIINEPTAAALSYGLGQGKEETVLVFDLGGGTFDVSILEMGKSAQGKEMFEVMSTDGDTHLGGDDYDNKVVEMLANEWKKKYPDVDVLADPQAKGRLLEAAEQAKKDLSSADSAQISLPYLTYVPSLKNMGHLNFTLYRQDFERETRDLTARCRGPVEKALKEAGLTVDDLTSVILVGGSTRIPAVQALVKEILGPKNVSKLRNPDRDGVDVDMAVAEGAAIQAGVLTKELGEVLLIDVTPMGLGVGLAGDVYDKLIPANTTIPAKVTREYTTEADEQRSVGVPVYQGERAQASLNRKLGKEDLKLPIRPGTKRGEPTIKVTFEIDANGVIKVTAEDADTGVSRDIEIKESKLSDEDIARMKADAEANAASDRRFADVAEAKTRAQPLIDQVAEDITEWGDTVAAHDPSGWETLKADLEQKSDALRQAQTAGSDDRLVDAYRDLKDTAAKIAEGVDAAVAARKQAQASAPEREAEADSAPAPSTPPQQQSGAPDFGDL